MPSLLPSTPANPTAELAQHIPGYDPAPVLAAQDQNLQDFLNLPVREILDRLGLPSSEFPKHPGDAPPASQPEPGPPPGNPIDPMALISPVTDALSTLGPGLFQGADPTTIFGGISQAFQSTGGSLQRSLGAVDDAWQGASGISAASKTTTAMANGTELAAQSDSLRASLASSTTNVAQARARLIGIITEFQATLAAIGPNIIFPWGWAAAIAAANKAIASTAEVMTELQTSLGAEAAAVTAAGAPVDVTAAPTSGGASPFAGLVSMLAKGAQAGLQAGTGAASSASQTAGESATRATDAATAPIGGAAGGVPPARVGAGGGGGVGGAGTLASRSIAHSPMLQAETGGTSTQAATVRATGGGMAGGGMMGAPYAPMAGHGVNASSNSHTAASFLHTTDQGGEIVGDLGNAAPPVLGEADPNEAPDIELRI